MADITLVNAARAYTQSVGGSFGDNKVSTNSVAGSEQGFQNFLTQAIDNTVSVTANAETTALNAVAGQANLVDVATAVTNAEMVVETVVAVRDKVISAYNDIIRMPL